MTQPHPAISVHLWLPLACLLAVLTESLAAEEVWDAREVQTLIQDGKVAEAKTRIASQYQTIATGPCSSSACQVATNLWRLRAMVLLFGDAPWNAEAGPEAALRKKVLARDALIDELALTLRDEDKPAGVVSVLNELIAKQGNTALSQPALLTALACVWDSPPQNTWYRTIPSPEQQAAALQRWVEKMPEGERARPARLLTFLAYSALSAEDLRYVDEQYAGVRGNPARGYSDIRYDLMFFRKGTPKQIDSQAYTLANIKKYGGVCIDQAYHTRGICHALGVPAVILAGSGSSGIGHAWVGYAKPSGGREISWDFSIGTTPDGNFSVGEFADPQTGQIINNLSLAAEMQELECSSDDRRRAAACARLIDVRSRLDTSFAQEILVWARTGLSRIPTHTATWESLIGYVEHVPGISDGQMETILGDLAKLGEAHPEIMLERFDRLRAGVEKTGQIFEPRWFEKMKAAVAGNVGGQLALEIRLAQVEEHGGQRSRACERLLKIVREHPRAGNPVLAAADALARMWRFEKKESNVLPMYLDLLAANKLPHPVAPEVLSMTMYFRLGQRMIAEYKRVGRVDDAAKLDDEIKKFIGG